MKDKQDKTFKRFYGRVAQDSILKSFLWGLVAGSVAALIVAFATWFARFGAGVWIALGFFIGVTALVTVILYFTAFRPTTRQIAEKIDRELGFEERMVTMLQFQNDDSYLAMRQREDAMEKLGAIANKKADASVVAGASVSSLKVGASALSISLASVAAAAALAGVLVVGLVSLPVAPIDTFSISYVAQEGGHIQGVSEQTLEKGENASLVIAIADDGYMFLEWAEDSGKSPVRQEKSVTQDKVYTAVFRLVGDDEMDEEDGDGAAIGADGAEDTGDQNGNIGQDDGKGGNIDGFNGSSRPSSGNSNSSNNSNGNPDSMWDSMLFPPEDNQGGNGNGNNGGSNDPIEKPANRGDVVIDGEIHRGDVFEEMFEKIQQKLASGEEFTEEERAILESYFNGLL